MSLDELAKLKRKEQSGSRERKPKVVKSASKGVSKPQKQPQQSGGKGGILSRIGGSSEGGTLVTFRNLKYEVTDTDIQELAYTIGEIKRGSKVDRSSAEVLFAKRSDAIRAVAKFNGLTLDGRPMDVTIADNGASSMNSGKASMFGSALSTGGRGFQSNSGPSFSITLQDPVLSGNRRVQSNSQPSYDRPREIGRDRNNKSSNQGAKPRVAPRKDTGRSSGGKREKGATPSVAELDAQMEAFMAKSGK